MNIPDPTKLLFLDIETVPCYPSYAEMPELEQQVWEDKVHYLITEEKDAAAWYSERSGVMAEFAKIICVSCGFLQRSGSSYTLKLKSIYGSDEALLLKELSPILNTVGGSIQLLCAHNGKEFDFPFIARRMVMHQMPLPACLDIAGLKPWEVPHIDTMELWKFGDRKAFTSLKLLTHIFGLPSPKDDISGADVKNVYYQDNDIERIARYCEKDVNSLCAVYLKMRNRGETYTPEFSL